MKKLILFVLALLPAMTAGAQGRFAKYLDQAEGAPFIVVDKQGFTLTLVDPQGNPVKEYGISCAINYGPKKVRGDHKTPEGTFKINQLLNAKGLTHDFKDGKGPVKDAYGPWFLRLDVPGFWDIGIHGTPFPESIGTRATEGCIRLRNEDILDLKQRVKVGTVVIILPDPVQ
ncbi:MAG: L,D-transpeptidase [Bacteroidales bacterium]|nr:L,D-transpeptidase [Bacteroidales bacterium]